jgi:PHD/YefM family antitoxin component YafN of YafNO toxin-antitoxin module
MRTTTVKEFRDQATKLLRGSEPLLITRRGKAAGLYLPLEQTQDLPFELRKELQVSLARSVRQAMEEKGITEEEILEGFERSRK